MVPFYVHTVHVWQAYIGEVCSHISALLFAIEAHTKLKKDASCTSHPCKWLPPAIKNVNYAQIFENRFFENGNQCSSMSITASLDIQPSETELEQLYDAMSKLAEKPSLLSITPGYSDLFVVDYSVMSSPLPALFQEHYLDLPYNELLVKCEDVFNNLTITDQQARNIELSTHKQVEANELFRFRAGRVTASRFKAAIHTDPSQPSHMISVTDKVDMLS